MKAFRILFLCTGNSARSIFAEFLLKKLASDRFHVESAGFSPKPAPHPLAVKVLAETFGIDAATARSKSWEEFQGQSFDFIITLCDNAKETCPVWPGQPILAHWGRLIPPTSKGTKPRIPRLLASRPTDQPSPRTLR